MDAPCLVERAPAAPHVALDGLQRHEVAVMPQHLLARILIEARQFLARARRVVLQPCSQCRDSAIERNIERALALIERQDTAISEPGGGGRINDSLRHTSRTPRQATGSRRAPL